MLPAKSLSDNSTPVTIFSGYLGAGKTTLLAKVLQAPKGLKIFALVNDFGEINIDASLISETSPDVIALSNGCACCSLGNDLSQAFAAIATQTDLDAVIIEASGVANLARLREAADAYPGFHISHALTLVDGLAIHKLLTDKYVGRTVAEQIEHADFLILNRGANTDDLAAKLKQPPPVSIDEATYLATLDEQLSSGTISAPKNATSSSQQHGIGSGLIHYQRVDLDGLRQYLTHPDEGLVRLKGTVVAGKSTYLVQYTVSGLEVRPIDTGSTPTGLQYLGSEARLAHIAKSLARYELATD